MSLNTESVKDFLLIIWLLLHLFIMHKTVIIHSKIKHNNQILFCLQIKTTFFALIYV